MIDTITIKIHDILRHKALVNFLTDRLRPTGKTIYKKDETDYPDHHTIEQKRIYKTFINFHDSHKLIETSHFNKLKSSHYDILYSIDYIQDTINFNLSIPKYIYSTNVFLLLTSPYAKNFSLSYHSQLSNALYHQFDYLLQTVQKIFTTEFVDLPIDWGMVSISRIDICYNQVFGSKHDALQYLKLTKQIKKKSVRDSSNMSTTWETSNFIKTDRYSFKIYHKGTEFQKHDKVALRKLREAGKFAYDIEYFQELADKTLRYEMSFRNSYLSYLFNNHIFRKNCEIWNECLELFKKDKSKKESKNYQKWRKTLSFGEKKAIKFASNYISKTKDFYLDGRYINSFNEHTNYADYKESTERKPPYYRPALFSHELFDLLSKTFLDTISQYHFTTVPTHTEILRKLDEHNAKLEYKAKSLHGYTAKTKSHSLKKIQRSKIVMALELLDKYEYDEIPKLDIFSRQTWYRLRKDLALLGYSKESRLPINQNVKFDLHAYYSDIIYNARKIPGFNFLRE